MTEPHPTYPDLPPIVDDAGYQTVRATVERLEQRARPEEAQLLRMLRRACDVFEASKLVGIALDAGNRAEESNDRLRVTEFRLQKGRERIAFLVRTAGLWKRMAKRLRESALHASRLARSNGELYYGAARDRAALKRALDTALAKQGAGTSEYARSQPSDACEIELWKSHAEGAWEDLATARGEVQAWRDAWGQLGPQSPDEVRVYEEVSKRVDREIAEHSQQYVGWLGRKLQEVGSRLHVQRAVSRHWQSQFEGCFKELCVWVRACKKRTKERDALQLDVHVLRMERDNAESEAEALKVNLANSQAEVDSANAALTREWSAMTVLRQELKASRAAHEACILERDDWHKLADDRARELCGFAPQTPMGKL